MTYSAVYFESHTPLMYSVFFSFADSKGCPGMYFEAKMFMKNDEIAIERK